MSCPFCARPPEPELVIRSQNGVYVPYPYPSPLPYENPVISGTTEEILKLRSGILCYEADAIRRAKGIYHWANVPSGQQIDSDFQKHYPQIHGQKRVPPVVGEFPYMMRAQRGTMPNPRVNLDPPPSRPVFRPAPNQNRSQRCQNRIAYAPINQPLQSSANGGRVQQAITHIDAASRILKTY